ncbi:MAG: xylose isomerase [Defluviitaleaceae bacterium]|nr:xylose isomerase [Defluviitaleaceae bacterium]MCL2836933.1 xylose isomerase [Defluviitaleaceae bacterium]
MSEFFPQIPVIPYKGDCACDPLSFHYYNPDEIILGKPMKDHLRFAMAWWHTLCAEGSDMFGPGTADKSFGVCKNDFMAHAKAKADAGFELMQKLGIGYFCFHDADIVDEADTLAETNRRLDEITDYIKEKMDKTGIKCLWGTCNLFSHKRFMGGAGTSPSADIFAYAAAKVKKAIELTVKLGGTGYVFWGGREGYETLLNTDMGLELSNMARLMRMAIDYARSIGFAGDFYIEPKPKEPSKHQYDTDVATACNFLRAYGLIDDVKMNIESNHATLAAHTFQHELRTASVNGVFGSIDANQGDLLLGWDTDQFPSDVFDATYCMLEVLKAGGFTNGGLNFDAKTRRMSYTLEDLAHGFITGMDTFALGLRKAAKIIEDGRLDAFVDERYASWKSGIGADIMDGKAGLKELEAYSLKKEPDLPMSGKQELLEGMINRIMFG